MRQLFPLNGVAVAVTLALGAAAFSSGAYAGDVVIGFAAPLTGASAHYGIDLKRGAELALDDANAQKLVIGGQPVHFVLDAEDDQGDPRTGSQVAQKLVDSKVAGVVGHFNSGTSIPASRIYNAGGIPMVSPTATNPSLTSQGYANVFRVVNSDAQMGQLAGHSAVQALKGKSIAVIDDRTAFGQGMADEFVKGVEQAGGKVVDREFTTDKSVDFRAQLTRMKSFNPDVVFWAGLDQQAGMLVKQMRQLGMRAVLLGGGSFENETFLKVAGESANGSTSWDYGIPLSKMKQGKEFDAKMKAKYNEGVVAYAPAAYDATWVLVNAMKKANSTDPKVYGPLIKTESFVGISGTIAFMPNGDMKDPAATFYKVVDGKWVPQAVAYGEKLEAVQN
ncbi:branched-chain amino acid ABC transporter substrate-binding protein [Paraburkholderia unamae]|uniref:Amino acid/amide ABC transporter substrate-binding protein (HAAT family) n=1 Tax=Paraburkholderia unamae TaxID=219649 RepID=A0ABX5KBP4_9BURK|nr:branched-chain amino acid ABC transporter substrate-binding protein [Paraburkholderia unamae]PVX73195.1 amino acid/amide ABC transporter substrate-binding protein (HAAT family) [Paraburkholderia unamae]CAG9258192.1 Amino acid/amide ABC transporter substrate-binding protein, HAAT family [Paraburkholderia unamae]